MTIMTRILRICRADIHGIMDKMEDQDLLLQQHLREMENSLIEKEKRIHRLAESKRLIQVELTAGKQECEHLENDLELSLRKNKDNIAKLLIRRQIVQRKHNEKLQQQYGTLAEELAQIRQLHEEQLRQYELLKVKAANYSLHCKRTTDLRAANLSARPVEAYASDDHEIELELLRRKEQLKKTGG